MASKTVRETPITTMLFWIKSTHYLHIEDEQNREADPQVLVGYSTQQKKRTTTRNC